MTSAERVQYGCAWDAPESWTNFDSSPTLRLERLPLLHRISHKNGRPFPKSVRPGDIVTGLPIVNASCRLLYCSHVLEHLAFDDCLTAISNSYRLLAPGGVWRIVLPDLRQEVEKYMKDSQATAAEEFMRSSYLGMVERPRGLGARLAEAFGNSRHLWMWDFESLSARLVAAGFFQVRRAQFGDSDYQDFADVENPERWAEALGVECRKSDR